LEAFNNYGERIADPKEKGIQHVTSLNDQWIAGHCRQKRATGFQMVNPGENHELFFCANGNYLWLGAVATNTDHRSLIEK
jgi:hypothetical protein